MEIVETENILKNCSLCGVPFPYWKFGKRSLCERCSWLAYRVRHGKHLDEFFDSKTMTYQEAIEKLLGRILELEGIVENLQTAKTSDENLPVRRLENGSVYHRPRRFVYTRICRGCGTSFNVSNRSTWYCKKCRKPPKLPPSDCCRYKTQEYSKILKPLGQSPLISDTD